MKPEEAQRKIEQGYTCGCSKRATRHVGNMFTCEDCLKKDAAIYGTANIRSTCGKPGAPEEYRLCLPTR